MSKPFSSLLLCLLGLSGAWANEPSAKSLKVCPNGHTALKDVPILYGLPVFDGPEGKALREAVKKSEVALGGCEVMPDSPRQVVRCTTCRFTYSILSTDRPKEGSWRLSSSDPAAFQIPLSELVRSFPLPVKSQTKGVPTYTQSLDRKYRVESESVSYETDRSAGKLGDQISEWLKERNLNPRPVKENSGNSSNMRWRDEKCSIWMSHEPDGKSTMVYASFSR